MTGRLICTGYVQEDGGSYESNKATFTIGKEYFCDNGSICSDGGRLYREGCVGDSPDEWFLSRWYTFVPVEECPLEDPTFDFSAEFLKMIGGEQSCI